ncbi:MAG: DUF1003 domain-containing protein [Gammaproteobacteria bacterium]|nr:DUF1003 domain-containing protein [Gammaproteobacteria bacterium]
MAANTHERFLCPICQTDKPASDAVHREMVYGPVAELIQRKHSGWPAHGLICSDCLNHFRTEYVEDVLELQKGELSTLEHEVLQSLREHEVLAKNINLEFEQQFTLGERAADKLAEFGGSWAFIGLFFAVVVIWIAFNAGLLLTRPFDPYPYILLNLALSCIAAIQAPVIMMSQKRQEAKDRLRAEHDYQVNLKAELEIRHLNGKLDLLLTHQWQRLLEIQRIQLDTMQDFARKAPNNQNS